MRAAAAATAPGVRRDGRGPARPPSTSPPAWSTSSAAADVAVAVGPGLHPRERATSTPTGATAAPAASPASSAAPGRAASSSRRRAATRRAARRPRARPRRASRRGCAEAGRDPGDVTLVVVTKYFPATDVVLLAELGVRDVGENRDQEAGEKFREVRRALSEAGAEPDLALHRAAAEQQGRVGRRLRRRRPLRRPGRSSSRRSPGRATPRPAASRCLRPGQPRRRDRDARRRCPTTSPALADAVAAHAGPRPARRHGGRAARGRPGRGVRPAARGGATAYEPAPAGRLDLGRHERGPRGRHRGTGRHTCVSGAQSSVRVRHFGNVAATTITAIRDVPRELAMAGALRKTMVYLGLPRTTSATTRYDDVRRLRRARAPRTTPTTEHDRCR